MSRLFITISLLLNLILGIFLFQRRGQIQDSAPHFISASVQPLPVLAKTNSPVVVDEPKTNRFTWAQLESEDYRTYIARLRAIGCPEQTIRDIIIADLDKLMAPQLRALNSSTNPPKYWKSNWNDDAPLQSLEKLNEAAELNDQKRGVLRELLGIDLAAERLRQKGETDKIEQRLGFLPETKRAQVRSIMEQANREEIYIREKSWVENDDLTPDELEKIKQINTEKMKAITDLLSSAELEQFNLWYSPSAARAREALTGMDNTEAEFLGVYQIQKDFDVQWAEVEPSSLSGQKKMDYESAKTEYESRLMQFLGSDRYNELLKRQDNAYRELARTANYFQLPQTVVNEVYSYKKILEQQHSNIQANGNLDATQKSALLNAVNEETERAVIEKLGPRAFKAYVRTGAAQWIH
jgi:hypothetical protein